MRTCRMWNNDHGACPTFEITVSNALSPESFSSTLLVSNNHAMFDIKNQIAANLGAKYSSDIQIMFQSRLVGDDDCEKNVIDFGLRAGSVLEVVRLVRYVKMVVFVNYMDDLFKPRRRATFSFQMVVPRNRPCAALVKAGVMQRFARDERSPRMNGMQKITKPHTFLLNYGLHQIRNTYSSVFSLGDELCLDDFPGQAANPYEVYVIDNTQCQCGTCDLAWMLDGWHCPQTWHTETSGFSDDELLRGTSSLGDAPVLSSSSSDG